MFTYLQTKKILDTATAKQLELWEVIKITKSGCSNDNYYLIKCEQYLPNISRLIAVDDQELNFYQESIPALPLDNLLPWLDTLTPNLKNFKTKYIEIEIIRIKELLEKKDNNDKRIFKKLIATLKKDFEKTQISLCNSLKQHAITQYFTDSQALTDKICEAIDRNF